MLGISLPGTASQTTARSQIASTVGNEEMSVNRQVRVSKGVQTGALTTGRGLRRCGDWRQLASPQEIKQLQHPTPGHVAKGGENTLTRNLARRVHSCIIPNRQKAENEPNIYQLMNRLNETASPRTGVSLQTERKGAANVPAEPGNAPSTRPTQKAECSAAGPPGRGQAGPQSAGKAEWERPLTGTGFYLG